MLQGTYNLTIKIICFEKNKYKNVCKILKKKKQKIYFLNQLSTDIEKYRYYAKGIEFIM